MSNAEVEISNHKHCDCFVLCFGVTTSFDHFYVSPWNFVWLVLWHTTIQSETNVLRITRHINDRKEKQKRPFELNEIKGVSEVLKMFEASSQTRSVKLNILTTSS